MQPFIMHRGVMALMDRANVDTDQIIPKQFLKSILRTGFGENLFFDWRYGPDGDINPSFELNALRYRGASILVTRNNFGCGSSREHAVWAIMQYGFRAVIAPIQSHAGSVVPAFADIFSNNALKNGLLTIELPEAVVESLFDAVADSPGLEGEIDLCTQTITLLCPARRVIPFDIRSDHKRILLEGLDDIVMTLRMEKDIQIFENVHDTQCYRAGLEIPVQK